MNQNEYEAWLADLGARRIVLAELHHAAGVEYVATAPFISEPTDADPNRVYDDILVAAVDITTRIDGLIGFGEVELLDDGNITPWVAYAWQGHPIRLYLGGPEWPRDEFRLLAEGRNGGITSARRGELVFSMQDESSVLDERIDTGQLPDDAGPVPLALGSVYNAPAFRVASQTLTYRASYLPVTSITAKDNGNPVTHATDTAGGTIELADPLNGELSVAIEEPHNTPAQVCQWVADYYGITLGTIELPSYTVGLYYNGDVTGAQILDELCEGLGAYWYIDALGQLTAKQRVEPASADITLVSDDFAQHQITLAETEPPWKGLTLRWGRNYLPLTNIAGVVEEDTPSEAARLRKEWRESTASQVIDDYPLAERAERNSVIANATDAATERDRLLALRSVRREVWSIESFLPLVNVGQAIAVDHPRLAGRVGRINSVARSPTRGTTNLEVWL